MGLNSDYTEARIVNETRDLMQVITRELEDVAEVVEDEIDSLLEEVERYSTKFTAPVASSVGELMQTVDHFLKLLMVVL